MIKILKKIKQYGLKRNMVPGKEMLEKFSRPISVLLRAWLPQKNPLL